MIVPYKKKITGNSTTTVLSTGCLLVQVVITCAVAGATWTIKIQDKASSPCVLIPELALSVPTDGLPNVNVKFDEPIPMEGGIDIITAAGTGTREVAVWLIVVQ